MWSTMSEPKPDAPPKAPANKLLLGIVGANLLVSTAMTVFVVTRPAPSVAPVAAAHGEAKGEKGEKGDHGEAKAGEANEGQAKEGEAKKEEHSEAKAEEQGEAKKDGEGKAEGEKKTATSDATTGNTARLEDIIVHLRNPEIDRYARLTLDVEMSTPSELTQLQPRTPQIRDAVITALSEETFESLRGAEGLTNMKAKLRDRIDSVVPGTVRAVYVSGFIVQ